MSRHRLKRFIEYSGVTGGVRVSSDGWSPSFRKHRTKIITNCNSFIRYSLTKIKQIATTATVAELFVVTIIIIEIKIFVPRNLKGHNLNNVGPFGKNRIGGMNKIKNAGVVGV